MGQLSGRLRLAAEPGERPLGLEVGCIGELHGLDRDAAGNDRVPALVDSTNRTASELPLDVILADRLDRCHPLSRIASRQAYSPVSCPVETGIRGPMWQLRH